MFKYYSVHKSLSQICTCIGKQNHCKSHYKIHSIREIHREWSLQSDLKCFKNEVTPIYYCINYNMYFINKCRYRSFRLYAESSQFRRSTKPLALIGEKDTRKDTNPIKISATEPVKLFINKSLSHWRQ